MAHLLRRVLGLNVDAKTGCTHWHSPLDVVAMKFKCCGRYYACHDCHAALADHPATRWSARVDQSQVVAMCGICQRELTLTEYLSALDACPGCQAPWNPGCRLHRELYFTELPI